MFHDDDEPLRARNRTEEFTVLRMAARRQAQWLKNQAGATPDTDAPPAAGPSPSPIAPPWVRVMSHCADLEQKIREKLETLHEQQQEVFQPKFTGFGDEFDENGKMSEDEFKHAVEIQAHDIQKLLKELERMVKCGVRPADPDNMDEAAAATNVQRHLSTRLTRILNTFKDGQQLYADRLKKRDERQNKFKHIGSGETHERLEREEKVANYLELGYTQADISELLLEEERQAQMSTEVQGIVQSIQELHEMFEDMRTLIVEQGTMLDRIDYNIERARNSTAKGIEQLKEARVQQSKCAIM